MVTTIIKRNKKLFRKILYNFNKTEPNLIEKND